jgi:large subunit ribosomal protein L22
METKAYFVNLPVSPKKARFYLPAIKKLGPAQSLEFLMYENTDAAEILYKAIKSAVASARQILKVEDNLLNFKLLSVEQGQKMKRYKPGSRGNAMPINRRMSHIKITIEAKTVKSGKKTEAKTEIKPETKKLEVKKTVKAEKPAVKSKK